MDKATARYKATESTKEEKKNVIDALIFARDDNVNESNKKSESKSIGLQGAATMGSLLMQVTAQMTVHLCMSGTIPMVCAQTIA